MSPRIIQRFHGDDDVAPIRDLLADHLWVYKWDVDHGLGFLQVSGPLKPPMDATSAVAVRRGLFDAFEAILEALEQAGYRHKGHPEFTISGRVLNNAVDWSQTFDQIKGEVGLFLYLSREGKP